MVSSCNDVRCVSTKHVSPPPRIARQEVSVPGQQQEQQQEPEEESEPGERQKESQSQGQKPK